MQAERSSISVVFVVHNALWLLGVCIYAPEVSGCAQRYARVGETTELSPGFINENLTTAQWRYNNSINIAKERSILPGQFLDRASVNQDYNLTINQLRITDSGTFTFISGGKKGQRPTVCISLQVQEVLTQSPSVTVFKVTQASNNSCVAWLQCTHRDKGVFYKWTVSNTTHNGSALQYHLWSQEGDITFNCTVSNMVSATSAIRTVSCQSSDKQVSSKLIFIVGAAGGSVFVAVIIIIVIVVYCQCKKSQQEADELTVYADIEEVTSNNTMKPCSVYETLDHPQGHPIKPPAQTVYDKIQFNRMKQQ